MRRSVLTVAVTLLGCAAQQDRPPFPQLSSIARVMVVMNYGRDTMPAITDTARLQAITAFVNARRSEWQVPWSGVPVPRVSAAFYRQAADKGAVYHFGAGPGFFEASSQPGDFASRRASAAETEEFLRLLRISEQSAD